MPQNSISYSLHMVIREWFRRRPSRPLIAVSEAITIVGTFVQTVRIDAMPLQTRLDMLTHLAALSRTLPSDSMTALDWRVAWLSRLSTARLVDLAKPRSSSTT